MALTGLEQLAKMSEVYAPPKTAIAQTGQVGQTLTTNGAPANHTAAPVTQTFTAPTAAGLAAGPVNPNATPAPVAAPPATPTKLTNAQAAQYLANYTDLQDAFAENSYGMNMADYASTHYNKFGQGEQRSYDAIKPTAPTPTTAPTTTTPTTSGPQFVPNVPPTSAPAAVTYQTPAELMAAAQRAMPAQAPVAQVTTAPVQAVTKAIDPSKTSAGLINSLLSENGPYLERARATAREEANSRGLLSSSIAAGAAEGAAIDRAGALATNDSQLYAGRDTANQNAENSVADANANRDLNAGTTNANAANDQSSALFGAQVNTNNLVLGSQLKKDEAAFGSTLNKDEAAFGSALTKDQMTLKNSFDQGNMNLQSYLDQQKMGYGSQLAIKEMGFGAQLDLMKMAKANGYDLEKMATSQGYTLEQMSTALGFDLTKMGKGGELDLERMAAANGYDTTRLATAFDNEVKLSNVRASLDVESRKTLATFETALNNSRDGKIALTNLTTNYAQIYDAIRRDPNLNAEDKTKALADAKSDWINQAGSSARLYGVDVSAYLPAVGIVATPATTTPVATPATTTDQTTNRFGQQDQSSQTGA